MLLEVLERSLLNANSKEIKVFLFPRNPKDKRKIEANGKVRMDINYLRQNKFVFDQYVTRNKLVSGSEYIWSDFLLDGNSIWTNNKDHALLLMAALEFLGFGKVTGNTEEEEVIIASGVLNYPRFRMF